METPQGAAAAPPARSSAFASLGPAARAAVLAAVVLVAAASAAIFQWRVYPALFHSDSAAHYVLARQMLAEGRLVPHDFAFNNQLILWRNPLFIALALKAGASGYRAYAIGSVLTFVPCFAAAFLLIERLVGRWPRSLLLAWLWFVPLGASEADYILGQQTHLVWTLFALALAVHAPRAAAGEGAATVVCALTAFAMAVEAPTRSLMVAAPLGLALLAGGERRRLRTLCAALAAALAAGWLVSRGLSAGHTLRGIEPAPLSLDAQFVARAKLLGRFFVDDFVGFSQFAGASSTPLELSLYGVKTAVLLALVATGLAVARPAWVSAPRQGGAAPAARPAWQFVGLAGAAQVAVGAWLVSAIGIEADVRHFLWGLMLLKLVAWHVGLDAAEGLAAARGRLAPVAAAVPIAFAVLASSSARPWLDAHSREAMRELVARRLHDPVYEVVKQRMDAFGTHRLYGSYWVVMRTEVLIPGAEPAALTTWGEQRDFYELLTVSSRRCADGEVLYLLDGRSREDAPLLTQVLATGARELDRFDDGRLLLRGPPVWTAEGCL